MKARVILSQTLEGVGDGCSVDAQMTANRLGVFYFS